MRRCWWLKVKRLLELLRHDDCDDSSVCECSRPVGDHLDAEEDDADLRLGAAGPRPSPPLQPSGQHCDQTVPNRPCASYGDFDAPSGRCRPFKLPPDVQVQITSPQQPAPCGAVGHGTVVSSPDIVNEPHYTVV